MENWQVDFEFLRVQHIVQKAMNQPVLPALDTVLFLIGIQELGRWKKSFSKEEKTDLLHLAVCRLLSYDGHFEFVGRDADGWPHWKQVSFVEKRDLGEQEKLLKINAVRYFNELEKENGGFGV